VKAGASFQVQKSRTIMMVKEMMGMSPLFAQFIAEKGLNFVLDNMEGKGIDQLKEMVNGWLQEMQQQKQIAMQQQQDREYLGLSQDINSKSMPQAMQFLLHRPIIEPNMPKHIVLNRK
jgi:peptidyl-tRNA hydrolase